LFGRPTALEIIKTKERKEMMKKIIMTLMAMLTVTNATFAEIKDEEHADSIETYDMEININALSTALGINEDQKETVTDFYTAFCSEMLTAGNAGREERRSLVDYAVEKNIMNMSYILTKEQYNKYVAILNTTLVNRGLRK